MDVRRARRARPPRGRGRARRARHRGTATASRCCSRTSRRCSSCTTRCPASAACSCRSTRASPPPSTPSSSSTPGPRCSSPTGRCRRRWIPRSRSSGTTRRGSIWVEEGDAEDSDYEQLLAGADPIDLERPDDERALISINYTSGTTGRPKGVMTNHRGAYLHALGVIAEARLTPRSTYLWTLPMFHCNGWAYPWAVTAMGAKHVCLPKVEAKPIWKALTEGGRDPSVRRADRPDDDRGRRRGRAARDRGVRVRGRCAAVADAARAGGEAEARRSPTSTGSRRPTGRWRCARGTPTGTSSPTTSRPSCARARASARWSRSGCGSSTRTWRTCPPTARRWARSSCAATT